MHFTNTEDLVGKKRRGGPFKIFKSAFLLYRNLLDWTVVVGDLFEFSEVFFFLFVLNFTLFMHAGTYITALTIRKGLTLFANSTTL